MWIPYTQGDGKVLVSRALWKQLEVHSGGNFAFIAHDCERQLI